MGGELLHPADFVLCADEKPAIRACAGAGAGHLPARGQVSDRTSGARLRAYGRPLLPTRLGRYACHALRALRAAPEEIEPFERLVAQVIVGGVDRGEVERFLDEIGDEAGKVALGQPLLDGGKKTAKAGRVGGTKGLVDTEQLRSSPAPRSGRYLHASTRAGRPISIAAALIPDPPSPTKRGWDRSRIDPVTDPGSGCIAVGAMVYITTRRVIYITVKDNGGGN